MSYPVVERISQSLLDTLNSVKVSNGYNYDLVVERPTRKGYQAEHLRAYLEQDNPDEAPIDAYNKIGWSHGYSVVVFLLPTQEDDTPTDTYTNTVWADIAKALMSNPQLGGLAEDIKILAPTYFTDVAGELAGFTFHFAVLYRTALDNPYEVAS